MKDVKQSIFLFLFAKVVHNLVDRFFDIIDPLAHFVNSTNNVVGHFLEPFLHLFEHVLHKLVELFGGGIFNLFVHLNYNNIIIRKTNHKSSIKLAFLHSYLTIM